MYCSIFVVEKCSGSSAKYCYFSRFPNANGNMLVNKSKGYWFIIFQIVLPEYVLISFLMHIFICLIHFTQVA